LKFNRLALAGAILGSLLLPIAGRGAVFTLDFEDLSGAGELPLNYHGLTFENIVSGGQGWAYYDTVNPPYNPSSGRERIYNYTLTGMRNNNNRILFNQNVTFLGLWMAGFSQGQEVVGYVGGVPRYFSTPLPNNNAQFGLFINVNWVGVDAISVNADNGDFYILDDIKFDTVVVPETAGTVALLGGAVLLLEGARRRIVPKPKPARVRVRVRR
jgi:hypothetical protein